MKLVLCVVFFLLISLVSLLPLKRYIWVGGNKVGWVWVYLYISGRPFSFVDFRNLTFLLSLSLSEAFIRFTLGSAVAFLFFSWYFMSSTFSLCVWVCVCVCVFLWIVSMSKHRAERERERERREWNTGYSNLWTTLKGFAFSLNQWVWVVDIDGFLIHFTFHRPTQMGLKCRETASRMVLQYEEPHIRDSLDKGIKTNKSL